MATVHMRHFEAGKNEPFAACTGDRADKVTDTESKVTCAKCKKFLTSLRQAINDARDDELDDINPRGRRPGQKSRI